MNARYAGTVNLAATGWGAQTAEVVFGLPPTQVAPAETARRRLTVVNDPDSVGDVWLVPNAGQKRGGVRVVPGAAVVFEHIAPVYAYTTVGNATVYTIAETGAAC